MNEVATIIEANPVAVLTNEQAYSEFYEKVKAQCDAFVPDLSTVSSRKAIASIAFRVIRSKKAIDDAGKELNREARERIAAVDAQRRKVRQELDELAAQVRQPLTEWEAEETKRQETITATLKAIEDAATIQPTDYSDTVKARIQGLPPIDPKVFKNETQKAEAIRENTIAILQQAWARLQKAEADAAELARLRKEVEERAEAERVAEQERRRKAEEEKKAEAARLRKEEERAERERERRSIEERARAEEKRKADEAIARAEAEKQAAIDRAAAERREREEEAARQKAEEEKRAADRKHRGDIMGAATAAIVAVGANEQIAQKIVLAIVANEIPNVTLRF